MTKQDKILLAHNKNFPGKLYSTLAGFIEAGETVEEAIHRELYEEVNIYFFFSYSSLQAASIADHEIDSLIKDFIVLIQAENKTNYLVTALEKYN